MIILDILVSFICYYRSQILWSKYYYDLIVHQPFLGYYIRCYVILNPRAGTVNNPNVLPFAGRNLSLVTVSRSIGCSSSVTWSSVLPALITVNIVALPPFYPSHAPHSVLPPARSSAFSDSAYLFPSCFPPWIKPRNRKPK